MNQPTVSILIPCYNEAGNIGECIKRTPQVGKKTEIIVINDGSTDTTDQEIAAAQKKYPDVMAISYPDNRGKSYALERGIQAASGDIIMILDADMTVPPESLHEFYDMFVNQKNDVLIGTRFRKKFSPRAMRVINRFSNTIAAFVFSAILKTRITDTLCGTKVIRREHAVHLSLSRCRWGDFELLRYAALNSLTVAECPVEYFPRTAGRSSMRFYPDGVLLYKRALEIYCEVFVHDWRTKFS